MREGVVKRRDADAYWLKSSRTENPPDEHMNLTMSIVMIIVIVD